MPETASDRWLSYAELGALLGCTPSAARMHARRRGWARRSPNAIGGHAAVLVPDEVAVRPRATHVHPPFVEHVERDVNEPNGVDQGEHVALCAAVAALTEQLAIANGRADRLERYFEEERKRLGELRTVLADARAAERIAAESAAGLRAEIAILTARRASWRRWFR
jgi:hypothetical protein